MSAWATRVEYEQHLAGLGSWAELMPPWPVLERGDMWSSSPDEGLIDQLTAEREEARKWVLILWGLVGPVAQAWVRQNEDLPEVPDWIEAQAVERVVFAGKKEEESS